MKERCDRRFQLHDLIVLVILAAMTFPPIIHRVVAARQLSRRQQCSVQLSHIALATLNYHSTFQGFPMGSGGTGGSSDQPLSGNANRLSAFVPILPFMEEQRLWESIANPLTVDGTSFPAMGPVPWYNSNHYKPWRRRPSKLVCPEDPNANRFKLASSYVVNYGDAVSNVGAPMDSDFGVYAKLPVTKRGTFARQTQFRERDCIGGTYHTLLFSESRIVGLPIARGVAGLPSNPSLALAASEKPEVVLWPEGRGAKWTDGSIRSTGFQTILPPNSPSATSQKGELEAVMSASSHHPGGVMVCFVNGAVAFISDSIDCGNTALPCVGIESDTQQHTPSPYGLWGALGTRGAEDGIELGPPAVEIPVRTPIDDDFKKQVADLPIEQWSWGYRQSFRGRHIDTDDFATYQFVDEDDRQFFLGSYTLHQVERNRLRTSLGIELANRKRQLLDLLKRALDLAKQGKWDAYVKLLSAQPIQRADRREQFLSMFPKHQAFIIKKLEQCIGKLDGKLAGEVLIDKKSASISNNSFFGYSMWFVWIKDRWFADEKNWRFVSEPALRLPLPEGAPPAGTGDTPNVDLAATFFEYSKNSGSPLPKFRYRAVKGAMGYEIEFKREGFGDETKTVLIDDGSSTQFEVDEPMLAGYHTARIRATRPGQAPGPWSRPERFFVDSDFDVATQKVMPSQISDMGDPATDPGVAEPETKSGGYGGSVLVIPPSDKQSAALWQFRVEPGTYAVGATWLSSPENATKVLYQISGLGEATVRTYVDQTKPPSGKERQGARWQKLGAIPVDSGYLDVRLFGDAESPVVADAVWIVPIKPELVSLMTVQTQFRQQLHDGSTLAIRVNPPRTSGEHRIRIFNRGGTQIELKARWLENPTKAFSMQHSRPSIGPGKYTDIKITSTKVTEDPQAKLQLSDGANNFTINLRVDYR